MMMMSGLVRHVFPAFCMHSCLVLVHPFMPTSTTVSPERHTICCTSHCRITSSSSIHCIIFVPTPCPLSNPDQAHLSPISLKHLSASIFHFYLSQHQNFATKALSHSSQARIPALIIYVSIPLAVFISHKKGFSWGRAGVANSAGAKKKDSP
jgi:hypothetical protein